MSEMHFRITLTPDPEGGYNATVPTLPGCISWGSSKDEANQRVSDAIRVYLASLQKHGDPIPVDIDAVPPGRTPDRHV